MLLGATAGVAGMAHILVGSVELAGRALGMNQVFVGVIVVAIVGNAAEHLDRRAHGHEEQDGPDPEYRGRQQHPGCIGSWPRFWSSPACSWATRAPWICTSRLLELIALVIAVAVLALVSQDGESHWMEGAMLLAVYFILALSFYHLPEGFR